ncbi:type II toxin-antitoxin system RelE/ParE family toxin [Candidatus Woesearchaeota archaeon]|nr:type II toxin-antitoxin system RelE/ParE family toxin [Candidatus Woesearchaeota archaeon]
MYRAIFSEKAEKQLRKLPKEIQGRILNSLERISIRPESYLERMVGNPFYKLRVGDYRVIVEIEHEKLIILVIKVGHRKNVYEKFFGS